ncbi:xaa-Arg dipeptidase-like [Ornithodoros turicata]|uniref:xaa-Arg dipeptidase-like n=1 Tax=Ornithodoros turicata TaxID=34597 RepID=UPI003139CC6D
MSSSVHDIVVAAIDKQQEKFNLISQQIWSNPELFYEEVQAHDCLCKALEDEGFEVQRHYNLKTAFRAEFGSGGNGPVVCIICEYDALPVVGHACGHNLIAEAGFAAGVAVKETLQSDPNLAGKVVVLGTPAEERDGGKKDLIAAGAFNDIDVAMMVHPSRSNELCPLFIGVGHICIEYTGKAAHASGYPWEGTNALDAAVACYNSLAYLRQHIKPHCRIHAIITNGGAAVNIVPEFSSMEIQYRAPSRGALAELKKKVLSCINAGAEATGCVVKFTKDNSIDPVVTNAALAKLYKSSAEQLGVQFDDDNPDVVHFVASSDMGNVCHTVPSIHPIYRIKADGPNHTPEFTEAAGQPSAQEPTLVAAKAMALTALELFRKPQLLPAIKEGFKKDMERSLSL